MGRVMKLSSPPQRIVSLVPSITELLHDLGLKDEVVGITKFCIHPKPWCKTKTKVGGTKKVNFERISELEPDLIIGNKEENTLEDITALEKTHNVFMTDVNSFADALEMIELLSLVCNREYNGQRLIHQLKDLRNNSKTSSKISAIYLIWKDPYFAVGQQTFINDMMEIAGFKNLILTDRYPEITLEEINNTLPQFLLLSTEPYPFANKHLSEISTHLNNIKLVLVDGEMFSWYGSRLLKSFEYFEQLKLELEEN